MHLSFNLLKDFISGVMRMTFLPSLAEKLFLLRLIPPQGSLSPQPNSPKVVRVINGLGTGTAAWPEAPSPTASRGLLPVETPFLEPPEPLP